MFVGGALEHAFRAFDATDGTELWSARLPAPPTATPMTYAVLTDSGDARQLVVIAAGGHGRAGGALSDHLIAFAIAEGR